MESIKSFQDYLNNIQNQAGMLAETAVSLNRAFQAGAEQLTREDEAKILRSLHTAVSEELERLKRLEETSKRRDAEKVLPFSLIQSILKITVLATTESQRAVNSIDHAFSDVNKKLPYGLVMISIRAKGLPDDVRVVSISELARESNRLESHVIRNLQQSGCMLFSEQPFSSFIDKLVADVREGRLCLPISNQKLSEIGKLYYLATDNMQLKWVPISRPQ